MNMKDSTKQSITFAFNNLMGVSGDKYAQEIITNGYLSQQSYDIIIASTIYNSAGSIKEYFGVVHWFYLEGINKS